MNKFGDILLISANCCLSALNEEVLDGYRLFYRLPARLGLLNFTFIYNNYVYILKRPNLKYKFAAFILL